MPQISSATAARVTTTSGSGTPVLKQGARGAAVTDLQKKLNAAGFSVGTPDGSFGPKTTTALKAFQRSKGMVADGIAGPKTWAALNKAPTPAKPATPAPTTAKPAAPAPTTSAAGTPTLKLGATGAAVKVLQEKLNAAGYKVGTADGSFGNKTLTALKAFQKAKGLPVDGVAGPKTWTALGVKASAPTAPAPIAGGKAAVAYVNGKATNITIYPVGNGQYMKADAARAYLSMVAEAKRAGINLTTTSAFRTNAQQAELYRRYLNGTGNLAAKPGYSNHQNGIAVDIGGINSYSTKAFAWMKANAGKYGFVNDVGGEYWHWTYKR